MPTREKIIIEISTQKEDFHAADFSHFMYLFRAMYVAALDQIFSASYVSSSEINSGEIDLIVARIESKYKHGISRPDLANLALKELPPEHDLDIADIHRRNPIDITFVAVPLAIFVVAVIATGAWTLSGGNLKFPGLETSIKNIRKKLNLPVRR
ncbi:hypothetical protein ACO0LM_08445 [Undibacterium sp. Di26W]|uniref:hypothetical protein n=1 Tax=Undibacterium sp. Di26W TaxID=3413035 RepID=UPI003BF1B538